MSSGGMAVVIVLFFVEHLTPSLEPANEGLNFMLKYISASFVVFALTGVAAADEPMTVDEVKAAAKADIEFVGNDYLRARLAENPDLILIDVRSTSEFELGRIPGAQSIPRGVAEFRVAEQVRDADTEIIVYCASGNRAGLVSKALMAQGYTNIATHHGFKHWSEDGLPVENKNGSFVRVTESD